MLATALETVDGHRVRVARLGAGPPLVLLHGYPENLQIWCEVAPRLAERFAVIAFDWPGMGFSEPWPGGKTPGHMADRLLRLLDAWQIERATIVGMDMGGQPALSFAARHAARRSRPCVRGAAAADGCQSEASAAEPASRPRGGPADRHARVRREAVEGARAAHSA